MTGAGIVVAEAAVKALTEQAQTKSISLISASLETLTFIEVCTKIALFESFDSAKRSKKSCAPIQLLLIVIIDFLELQ